CRHLCLGHHTLLRPAIFLHLVPELVFASFGFAAFSHSSNARFRICSSVGWARRVVPQLCHRSSLSSPLNRAGCAQEPSNPDNVSTVKWRSLMRNERNSHRTPIVLFAIAVTIAILAAFVTTVERVGTRTANNETPPGTTGLAKPRAPLDRAPGQPALG